MTMLTLHDSAVVRPRIPVKMNDPIHCSYGQECHHPRDPTIECQACNNKQVHHLYGKENNPYYIQGLVDLNKE